MTAEATTIWGDETESDATKIDNTTFGQTHKPTFADKIKGSKPQPDIPKEGIPNHRQRQQTGHFPLK